MKLATIGLGIALALPPSRFAFAEGTLNYSLPVARPVVRGVTVLGPVAIRPRHAGTAAAAGHGAGPAVTAAGTNAYESFLNR
jgi:hypothetical protein